MGSDFDPDTGWAFAGRLLGYIGKKGLLEDAMAYIDAQEKAERAAHEERAR